jgi:hypothetical protein
MTLKEPVVGLRQMARVTRPGGLVAACVWDHDGGGGPLSLFWEAVRALDRDVEGEAHLAGARDGHLAQLFRDAGIASIEGDSLSVTVTHPSFDDWWEPFTFGVGPAGSYVAGLEATRQIRLRDRCRDMLPSAPLRRGPGPPAGSPGDERPGYPCWANIERSMRTG